MIPPSTQLYIIVNIFSTPPSQRGFVTAYVMPSSPLDGLPGLETEPMYPFQKKYPILQHSVQCQGTQIEREQLFADPHVYPTPVLKVSQTPLGIPRQDFPRTRHPTSAYTAHGVVIHAGGNC